MPCSDWRIFAYISLYQIFIKHYINNNLPLQIIAYCEQMYCYTHHMCLRVHLNICVSENAFRFMAGRHKHRPDLYNILYVRPVHGFYARQLYVQIRLYFLFLALFICPFSFAHRRRYLNAFIASLDDNTHYAHSYIQTCELAIPLLITLFFISPMILMVYNINFVCLK